MEKIPQVRDALQERYEYVCFLSSRPVILVRSRESKQPCVAKPLRRSDYSPKNWEKIKDRVLTLRSLAHPCLVEIYEVIELDYGFVIFEK